MKICLQSNKLMRKSLKGAFIGLIFITSLTILAEFPNSQSNILDPAENEEINLDLVNDIKRKTNSYSANPQLGERITNLSFSSTPGHLRFKSEPTFSPDGSLIAAATYDSDLLIWDIKNQTIIKEIPIHSLIGFAFLIEFSPDGATIATGGDSGKIALWNVETGEMEFSWFEHTGEVFALTFSQDGSLLASGGWDGKINVWNLVNGDLELSITNPENVAYHSLSFSSDGTILVSGHGDGYIKFWEVNSGVLLKSWDAHDDGARFLTHFPLNQSIIVFQTWDNIIRFWDEQGQEIKAINASISTENTLIGFKIVTDGQLLVSFSQYGFPWDPFMQIWNLTSNTRISLINTTNTDDSYYGDLSPDGTVLSFVELFDLNFWNIAHSDNDFDYDGMSDSWEEQNNLDINDFSDKFGDEDSDGLLNYMEYFANTNATNPDTDHDGMLDGWEYKRRLNPLLNDTQDDTDNDGMPNYWEYQMGLRPTFNDSNRDKDQDGVSNLDEYIGGWNASDAGDLSIFDSDNDGMINSWEIYYGLDHNLNDAQFDNDNDGMSNIYEYQMYLNPTFNDSYTDKDHDGMPALWEYQMGLSAFDASDGESDLDGDGLTNYQEFLFGSWANQTDTDLDGMSDYYEFQYGLIPYINDAQEDKDNDGMPNSWEATYQLQANNSNDAEIDSDGDGITNINEYRTGTNPRDFLSVSLFSFSFIHISILAILVLALISLIIYFKYSEIKRKELLSRLKILFSSSEIIKSVDSVPPKGPLMKTLKNIDKAKQAELQENWGQALKFWNKAKNISNLELYMRIFCIGESLRCEFKIWSSDPGILTQKSIINKIDEWQKLCEENRLFDSFCEANILRAKIELNNYRFEEAEMWLLRSLEISELHELSYYKGLLEKELSELQIKKDQVTNLMESETFFSIKLQEERLQTYIKNALKALR
ncbi:MAG: hypothetical protein ACW967_06085 [Candidatus Hodarchaeales archaeon]